MEHAFVIGDIHGKISMLKELLKNWDCDKEQLVFLGDYIDRGEDSYGVIHLVQELIKNYGAVGIGGNHEWMLLDWLNDPEDHWFIKWREDNAIIENVAEAGTSQSIYYYMHGGDSTINSFYDDNQAYKKNPSYHAEYIKNNFAEDIRFIQELPDYYEWGNYIFVHAGVDLGLEDWRNTPSNEMRWTRKGFHKGLNETGKIIVFGHHPTRFLNEDKSDKVWLSPCKTKVGIDGGAVSGGLLHGLQLNGNENRVFSVYPDLEVKNSSIHHK